MDDNVTSPTLPTCPRCGSVLLGPGTHSCVGPLFLFTQAQEGWRCPGCQRCYSPAAYICGYCGPPAFTGPPQPEPSEPTDTQRLDWYDRLVSEGWQLTYLRGRLSDAYCPVRICGVSTTPGTYHWCRFYKPDTNRLTPDGTDLRSAIDAAAREMGWLK